MLILGIETSCDETAATVIKGEGEIVRVLSNIVSSQAEIHGKYGGVVPEVAAREHVLSILPVINEALTPSHADKPPYPPLCKGGINPPTPLIQGGDIDAIAVTVGPGLITSLLVGVETAKALAFSWRKPLIAVNHIEGHIYANFITPSVAGDKPPTPPYARGEINPLPPLMQGGAFPALILTVSGGHNMLVLMKDHGKLKIIGETRDDAAGEAFDKAAAMLELGYPGGPAVSACAEKFKVKSLKLKVETPHTPLMQGGRVILPRPMIGSRDYDFSFSGLKTALLYEIKKDKDWKKKIPEYAHEFQQAVIDVLVNKTIRAAREHKVKTVMLSGGVAANKELRAQLEKEALQNGFQFKMPEFAYTTDNAAMIATAGYFKAREKKFTDWRKLKADCNLEL